MPISSSLEGFILIDELGQVIQLNRAAELLFQCDINDVTGRSLEYLLPDSLSALEEKYALIDGRDGAAGHETAAGNPSKVFFDHPFCARRRDGSLFPVNLSFCLFEVYGQRMAYVWVIEVAHIGQPPFSPNTTPNLS